MRKAPIYFVALFVVAIAVAACGGSDNTSTTTPAAAPATSAAAPAASGATTAAGGDSTCGTTVDEIAAKAKTEGQVNLIALPDTWANYKGILDSFKSKYGIKAPVATPDASSADELTAIETLRGQPDMPEVVDVGPSFTSQMVDKGYAETYKPTVWDEIPDNLKDPNSKWVAAYYGVLSIASNTTLVKNPPQTWADLKKPEYKGQVTINGDPREAGAAFAAVMAASLANGGSFDDIMPGIQFMADLKKAGNLQQIDVTEAAVISGDVPIALDWTYNFPALQAALTDAGFAMQVVVPSDGVYGGYYAQSVVTEAKHPCAARLWLEHLVGDDGALGYLQGGAIPARFAALEASGKITADLKKNLPTADVIAKVSFPTQAQTDAAKKILADNWGPMVADA
ncbi:MAG: putative spermidine/putrescine transport system substrate-binding protein [Gaiellaceae bacterium]|nr:putative spermidine/putrescine transport system substrate-binding protein [Gaiellaceae bacterium]